jgi:hypothetical protein
LSTCFDDFDEGGMKMREIDERDCQHGLSDTEDNHGIKMTFEEWWDNKYADPVMCRLRRVAQESWDAATKVEREECAKLCESEKRNGEYQYNNAVQDCADSIRMRSNNKQKGSD